MNVENAIKNRRTIRKFTDYKVTKEEIEKLIEAARWAPSWANTQSWEFVVVQDKDKIKEISNLYSENNPAQKGSLECSAIILGCAKEKLAGYKNGELRTELDGWDMFDLGLAFQNINLCAYEMGLGGVIVGAMDHTAIAKVIEVPEGYKFIAAMPIGKPAEEKTAPKRRELEEILYYDKF